MFELNFIGNLVADPTINEVRVTRTGEIQKVCHFRVAVNRGRDSAGNQLTEYVNCSAWRGLADICKQYLAKGRKVFVRGIPKATKGTDNNGNQYANLECAVQNVEFLSPRSTVAEGPAPQTTAPVATPAAQPQNQAPQAAPANFQAQAQAPVQNIPQDATAPNQQFDQYIMINENELPF